MEQEHEHFQCAIAAVGEQFLDDVLVTGRAGHVERGPAPVAVVGGVHVHALPDQPPERLDIAGLCRLVQLTEGTLTVVPRMA